MRPHLSTGTLMMPKSLLRARRLTALLAVSLLTLAACGEDGDSIGGSTVAVVNILTLPNGQALTNLIPDTKRAILGVPLNASANFVDKPVTWVSTNPAAAVWVGDSGYVRAVAGGSTYLKATAGGRTDSVLVAVRYPVGTITLTPVTVTLNREGAQALTTVTHDTQNAVVTGRTVTYVSSNTAVATVSAAGVVTATAAAADNDTTRITATAANALDGGTVITATKLITVLGDARVATVTVTGGSGLRGNTGTTQLTGVARSGLGNVIAAPLTWTTNSAPRATVDGTGLVTWAGGVGAVNITATATGAGAGGSSPAAVTAFEVLTAMVADGNGQALAIPASTASEFALNGTGNTSFTIVTSGGTGDVDMLAIPNGTTGYQLDNANGGTGTAGATGCLSWAAGNGETCTRTFGAQSFWRIRFWAFGAAAVTTTYTATLTP
jgi:hypothetical protein